MNHRYVAGRGLKVCLLVVEVDVRLQNRQDMVLWYAPQEERLIDAHSPALQGSDHSLMGGSIPGGHDRDANDPLVSGVPFDLLVFKLSHEGKLLDEVSKQAGIVRYG